MPTYVFRCADEECAAETDHFCSFEGRPAEIPCGDCDGPAAYQITSPMVMNHSTPDGQRAKSDPGWHRMKNASKLRVQKANTSNREEKAKIQAEIDKISGVKRAPKKRAIDTIKL